MGKGMKAGKKPRVGQKQMQKQQMQQMQQLQQMQERMEKAQEDLEKKEVETTAGGGAVKVRVNGKHELVSIELKPEIVDPEDIDMLQDLILAAVNEGVRQIDEMSESEMSKLTGGINIPGLF